jgi:hypothetical protein
MDKSGSGFKGKFPRFFGIGNDFVAF